MTLYQDLLKHHHHFKEIEPNATGAGQACGHHLFGAGSAWAAVVDKRMVS